MHYDKEFLLQLDKNKNKTIYAKIIALKFDESPIETIEGRVTQGSINIDGSSAVRRSCSLTMVAQNFQYNDFYWGLNTKFKLEIGIANFINSSYPDIIWFNQGIYLITSFNTSHSTNNFTISLQGKDKMCLLNGEIGGTLESSIDFGTLEQEIDGMWIKEKIPIKDIIKNMVHVYGKEPYHNIIINDLDDSGLELLEYRYDVPMYLYRKTDSSVFDNILMNGEKECVVNGISKQLKDLTPYELDVLVDTLTGTTTPAVVIIDNEEYYVAKVEYGQTAGYRLTDLVFAGDLISNVGESVTSVLDKIKNMLSEFEYFYDLSGQFVFQRKQSFINTLWTPIEESNNEKYVENYIYSTPYSYIFNQGELVTSFNNNPNLQNLRNDFSVWGNRKGTSGIEIPVHMRYAIDVKPEYYISFDKVLYTTHSLDNLNFDLSDLAFKCDLDWRELIYQMSLDYFKYNTQDDFELELRKNNLHFYPTGRTGYEQYYTDLQGFWRELYNPMSDEDDNNFYHDGQHIYWNKNVFENPESLNFWFDFLDQDGHLSKFGVQNIGARPKAINDTAVKSIYFRETPNVIFGSKDNGRYDEGYKFIQIPEDSIDTMFTISAQGKSAKQRIDELLYAHSYCIENATIQTIPIYYLQPNTRIYLQDDNSGLQGDYIINKMTIPLSYNGQMSITAIKAAEDII